MRIIVTLGLGALGFILSVALSVGTYMMAPIVPCERQPAATYLGTDSWGIAQYSRPAAYETTCTGSELAAYHYGGEEVRELREARLLQAGLFVGSLFGGVVSLVLGGIIASRIGRKKPAPTQQAVGVSAA